MKTKNKRKLRLGKRYLWSFFTVVIAVDLIITSVLFTLFSTTKISSARQFSIAQLEQVCTATDILYSSLEAISNQILTDNDTTPSLFTYDVNRIQEVKACIKLRNIKSTNPFMRYVGFYNASTKRYISNSCVGDETNFDPSDLYEALGDNRYACFLRKTGSNYPMQYQKLINVYTFVFEARSQLNDDRHLIVLDVDESYYNDVLENIRIAGEEQQVIFSDDNGNMIAKKVAGAEFALFSASLAEPELDMAGLYQETTGSGSMVFKNSEGQKCFVTYAKTNKSNWMITNIVPYSSVLEGLGSMAGLTSLLFFVILGFGFIISSRMSKTLYAPIKLLYESYVSKEKDHKENELDELNTAFADMYSKTDQLEQGLISSYNATKNQLIRNLLYGNIDRVKKSMQAYKELEINLEAPHYAVLLIDCVPLQSNEEKNGFIHHYALENMLREILGQHFKFEFLRVDENRFAVLLYATGEVLPSELRQDLTIVTETMKTEFFEEATICIGNLVDAWQNINMCYEQTKIAMNSRSYQAHGEVFLSLEAPDPMRTDQYFNGLHVRFSEYIRAGNIEACANEFDHALSSMSNISFKTAKSYFKHIAMSVLDDFAVSFEKGDDSFNKLLGRLEEMDANQSVASMKNLLMDYFSTLIHQLELNRKGSNQDAAERARLYIDKNYTNPDLTIALLAEVVGLSPAYLGKVFTSVTSYTFNDYLNLLRMNKAAALLKQTQRPIAEISQSVGIINTNYFYSRFKKQFSMTPTEYRKQHTG